MQSAGFYGLDKHNAVFGYRHFNTYLGDVIRGMLTAAQNKVIKEHGLIEQANDVGSYLTERLHQRADKHPDWIQNVRGKGTYLAYDVDNSTAKRDALVGAFRANGVLHNGCSDHTMRLRPALCFEKRHADIFLDRMDLALEQVKRM